VVGRTALEVVSEGTASKMWGCADMWLKTVAVAESEVWGMIVLSILG
jgi:hypothetical protein